MLPLGERSSRAFRVSAGRLFDAVAGREWTLWACSIGYGVGTAHITGFSCPFRYATGYDCPACGGTRAVESLVHGRVMAALHYNFLVVTMAFLAMVYILARRLGWNVPRKMRTTWCSQHQAVTLATLAVSWTVSRNLPQFSWFSTAWNH